MKLGLPYRQAHLFVRALVVLNSQLRNTLTVQNPLSSALNISANFGYHFSDKISGGFNIDVIGFTPGKKSVPVFTSNGAQTSQPVAKPTTFNVLLTGDHDYGSLNSEFLARYKLNDKWSVRGIYQFLFTEYETTYVQKTLPDGSANDRFRNKGNNFGVGVSFHF